MERWMSLAGMLLAGVLWCALSGAADAAPAPVDLTPWLKRDQFERVKISPDGAYYAVTMPLEDRTALVVLRRADQVPTAKIIGREHSVVDDFWWASNERIVVSMAERRGARDRPVAIGELHAINADGSGARLLASPYGVNDSANAGVIRIDFDPAVFMLDTLPNDTRNVLVSSMALSSDPNVRIEKLDIHTRRRTVVATAPVKRADFTTDASGQVRFAHGADVDNTGKLYYRDGDGKPWRLINDEASSFHRQYPLGFSADGRLAYMQVQQPAGPDVVMSWDPATGTYERLLGDEHVDPFRVLRDLDGRTPIGVSFMTDRVRNHFFDENTPTARLYRALEKGLGGQDAFHVTSVTADRRLALVYVWSDRNNGDYFVFDTQNKRAERIFSRREWFAPSDVPPSRYVSLKARDGMALHGYLTLPMDADTATPQAMVVMPHGGPFGIFDDWSFDDDTQLLAAAGYAVLRINYRGSGNHGRAHQLAGARQWGGSMQDDLTDATRWAIAEGVADASRICIYGASYGGYAALMGVAREPALYRCAAGYVGVYDLPMMHREQSSSARWAGNWALEWMGDRKDLVQRSPVNLAAQIRAPVFLAAGGKDERAPVEHTEKMAKALKKAGTPVQTLYFANEGHGFYTEPHRREYYSRLLAFLSEHLGGARAR